MQSPKVSILCLAYNQNNYIKQCIESILTQQTNFDYELLIHDDASTDGTADIIRGYERKHPNIIRAIYQKQNQYQRGVKITATYQLPRAKGEYVALCEGDDYWTDNSKLQKQVDFLEQNKDYAIHSSNAIYVSDDKLRNGKRLADIRSDKSYTIDDFAQRNPLITCTVMFRNLHLPTQIADLLKSREVIFGDWALYASLLVHSDLKAYKSKNVTAAYRLHQGGIFSSLTEAQSLGKHIRQLLLLTHLFERQVDRDRSIEQMLVYARASIELEHREEVEKLLHLTELSKTQQERIDLLTRELEKYKTHYDSLLQSYSWKITEPLRLLSGRARRRRA